MKVVQRTVSESKSARQCWFPSGSHVEVEIGRLLIAHVTKVHRCGSPWSCPLCTPVVRARRALEIDQGLSGWLERGGGAQFITPTVRHGRRDPLAPRLALMSRSNAELCKGRPWERLREQLGFRGSVKAPDLTWGEANGWHAHAHGVWLFDQALTHDQEQLLDEYLFSRWATVCKRLGFGTLNREVAVDRRAVKAGADAVAGYVTKVEGGWTAGKELVRTDLKRSGGRFTPVQLLVEFVATGEKRFLRLWQEYEQATFSKRAVMMSPGLRQLLDLGDEQSDVELAASEGTDVTVITWLVDAISWRSGLASGDTARGLEQLERRTAEIFEWNDRKGLPTEPRTIRWDEP